MGFRHLMSCNSRLRPIYWKIWTTVKEKWGVSLKWKISLKPHSIKSKVSLKMLNLSNLPSQKNWGRSFRSGMNKISGSRKSLSVHLMQNSRRDSQNSQEKQSLSWNVLTKPIKDHKFIIKQCISCSFIMKNIWIFRKIEHG